MNNVKKVAFPLLCVISLYAEGALLAGDRLPWWSFPSYILAIACIMLFAALSVKVWINGNRE